MCPQPFCHKPCSAALGMPGFKLQEPQMAELERCVWAQATRVFPRPQLLLLTPGPVPGEEVVRAGTLAPAVDFFNLARFTGKIYNNPAQKRNT